MRNIVVFLLIVGLFVFAFGAAAQDDMSMEIVETVVLGSVDADGSPEEEWLTAWGFVTAEAAEDGALAVNVFASNLVPEGVYTLWGVNMGLVGMDVAPAGGAENNAFTASEAGTATISVTIPAEESYEMLALAYHSDGQTYGDNPGAMGEVTFTHLMGAFPGMEMMEMPEVAVDMLPVVQPDGIPEDVEEDAWTVASVVATVAEVEDSMDMVEVTIYGANLVADGLYTTWAVNEGLTGMQVAPAGGTPDNEFTANADGFGINTIMIAVDDIPDALALAYHSDG
ncbi:MAG: hypothetical protein AAFR22_25080, partial [Chloroflexota bacterium]